MIWWTCAPLISFQKNNLKHISKFQKNLKINHDVVSIVSHKLVNFQLEIMCILSCTKITNIWRVIQISKKNQTLSFLCS
jgi:diphthamide synthase subunit DPH2